MTETEALRSALLEHYDRHARDLPWRGEEDPYRIWVSEVMLQQTRVSTVLGYYDSWLQQFPDVESLARAELDDVLLAWEGLGYYRRARFLHRGARMVREEFGGSVPSTYRDLREIPGLGEYAAGAVASIAFGEAVPAVDGNVRRVLSRLCDEAEPSKAWLRERAGELVDPLRPGDWNQALMELGATVCTPSGPDCDRCPVASWCAAREAGSQEDRPVPRKRPKVAVKTFVSAVVVAADGRALVVRRPEGALLGGLWSFPDAEIEGADDALSAARAVVAELGVRVGRRDGFPRTLAPVRHRFSHIDATYRPVVLPAADAADGGERFPDQPEGAWVELDDPGVALPVAQQRIVGATREMLAGAPGGA